MLNIQPTLRWSRIGITVAGSSGRTGNNSKQLNAPKKLFIDWSYTLYITGQVSGLNRTGSYFLNSPHNVQVDLNGNIYVSDTFNHRVQP